MSNTRNALRYALAGSMLASVLSVGALAGQASAADRYCGAPSG
ncbi:hypothetical protein SGFS_077250 [Streptomyces graminofaciens]|uniref:Uncharacterized protein n=1 Tax=Streptomyces graminofaciens TaxID=68212 RepID=A0ABN5VSI2_9ACTN|nr:hypothetical protein [Streptomyces graminofaciens]BBC36431.1 hypothetical protein SGFS_077250 [Streptomyces graminofaciens]